MYPEKISYNCCSESKYNSMWSGDVWSGDVSDIFKLKNVDLSLVILIDDK